MADLTGRVCPQLRKVERDKKTMDQEIVDLTNKLLDAKNTIDHLEELNVSDGSAPDSLPPPTLLKFLTLALCSVAVCRSATGRTVTWPCSCSSATSHTSGTISLLM